MLIHRLFLKIWFVLLSLCEQGYQASYACATLKWTLVWKFSLGEVIFTMAKYWKTDRQSEMYYVLILFWQFSNSDIAFVPASWLVHFECSYPCTCSKRIAPFFLLFFFRWTVDFYWRQNWQLTKNHCDRGTRGVGLFLMRRHNLIGLHVNQFVTSN